MTTTDLDTLLRHHRGLLEASIDDDRAFLAAYNLLLADVSAVGPIDDGELEQAVDVHSPFLRQVQQRYLALEEATAAELLLGSAPRPRSDDRSWSAFAADAYRRVADLEQLPGFADFRLVVAAGSGALPSTLLWMADHFPHTRYVGLDIDERCVGAATRLAAHLQLPNVTFVHADAADHDYAGVDFVFVANQVRPKHAVLERIADTVERSISVVVREPTDVGRLFAEPVHHLAPGYRMERVGNASTAFLSRDVFLRLDTDA